MSNRIARLIQLKSWRGFTPQHADQVSNLVFHGAHSTDSRTAVVVRPVVLCVRVPNSSSGCSCNVAWRWSEVATILMYLSIAGTYVYPISFSDVLTPSGFSALRMYAIYGRDRRILSLVTVMGVINPIVNIVGYLLSRGLRILIDFSIITLRSHSKQCPLRLPAVDRAVLLAKDLTSSCESSQESQRAFTSCANAGVFPVVSLCTLPRTSLTIPAQLSLEAPSRLFLKRLC